MNEPYPHTLTLRFKTPAERRAFIAFWLSSGENQAGLYTLCDPEAPSWMRDEPEMRLARSPGEDEIDAYG